MASELLNAGLALIPRLLSSRSRVPEHRRDRQVTPPSLYLLPFCPYWALLRLHFTFGHTKLPLTIVLCSRWNLSRGEFDGGADQAPRLTVAKPA